MKKKISFSFRSLLTIRKQNIQIYLPPLIFSNKNRLLKFSIILPKYQSNIQEGTLNLFLYKSFGKNEIEKDIKNFEEKYDESSKLVFNLNLLNIAEFVNFSIFSNELQNELFLKYKKKENNLEKELILKKNNSDVLMKIIENQNGEEKFLEIELNKGQLLILQELARYSMCYLYGWQIHNELEFVSSDKNNSNYIDKNL